MLDGIDLRVRAGTVFALLGPNGAGKTTTVRILATLAEPDGGSRPRRRPRRRRRPARGAAADQPHRPVRGDRRAPDREGEPRDDGPAAPTAASRPRARGPASCSTRFDLVDAGRSSRRGLLGRHAAAPGSRGRPGREPRGDLPRRAHDRPRPPRPAVDVGLVTGLTEAGVTVFLTTQYLDEAERSPTRSRCSTAAGSWPRGRARELKQRVGGARLELPLADAAELRRRCRLPRRARRARATARR